MVRVCHLPLAKENPYQRLVTEGLEEHGFNVVFSARKDVKPAIKLLPPGEASIYNFHWIGFLATGRNGVSTIFRTLLFVSILAVYRLSGRKLVITLHNLVPHDKRAFRLQVLARKMTLKLFDAVVVHSRPALAQAERHLGPHKGYTLIPNPNYTSSYPNAVTRAQAREHFALDEKTEVFLMFGYIRPYKQVEEVLRFFERGELGKGRPGERVLIVAGKDRRRQKGGRTPDLFKRVIFHGTYVPEDMVQYYFKCADFFLLPSQSLSCLTSGSAVLAVGFKVPIIASDGVPYMEFVESRLGVTCDFKSPGSLLEAVDEVRSWDRREYLSRRAEYLRRTDPARVVALHARMYRKLLEG
jgi:glycosyltransferase involved in cell wall biosynthesis